jgi:hypothetical protein
MAVNLINVDSQEDKLHPSPLYKARNNGSLPPAHKNPRPNVHITKGKNTQDLF